MALADWLRRGVGRDRAAEDVRAEADAQASLERVLDDLDTIRNAALVASGRATVVHHLLTDLVRQHEIDRLSEETRARSLWPYGYKCFSQNDEDGILEEIFRRIGVTSRTCLEIGVGDGLENNTLKLLHEGWRGVWVEADGECVANIQERVMPVVPELDVLHAAVTAEDVVRTIESRLAGGIDPENLDLLGLDIDGNDYWVLERLLPWRPRVIVVEYNAAWGPHTEWIMAYAADYRWNHRDNYYGASLKALTKLCNDFGYELVGCNFIGVNAFFVRKDCIGDHFLSPFDTATHFRPPRFAYMQMRAGHDPAIGPFVRSRDEGEPS
jgi:hypothetical protein